MESSPENFESLQKLLRLKRHEQPSPRYFNEFSSRVIARLEAGEGRVVAHWWQRWGFDLRPAMLGAGAVCACAAVFFGLNFGSGTDSGNGVVPDSFTAVSPQPEVSDTSTNPVFNTHGQGFDNVLKIRPVPAGFDGR